MAIFNSKLLNYQKAIFFRWAISCHHGMLKLHILFETEDQVDALDGGGRTARGAQFLQLYRLLFILLGFDDFNRKSSHISMIFPLKPPFIRDFPASHVWLWDGIFESNFTALKHLNTHTHNLGNLSVLTLDKNDVQGSKWHFFAVGRRYQLPHFAE